MTFMLHITLHIKSVIDVGGVSIALGELCLLGHKIITNPLHVWDILATRVAVCLSKAYKARTTRYTRTLSQQR